MAKKVLTPEEVQAKMEKKSNKRKLFFGTFTKALAFFLAIAMAYSLATIAFVPETAPVATGNAQGGTSTGTPADNGDGDLFGNDDPAPAPSDDGGSASTGNDDPAPAPSDNGGSASTGTSTGSGNSASTGNSSGNTQQSAKPTKADVVKAINDATAKAAKASYKWERSCYYTRDLDVSGKDTLNKVIGMVDKSGTATVESVVGGFLDISGKDKSLTANVVNGKLPDEGMKEKFLLVASNLTEADIKGNNFQVNGNTYSVQLNACNKPQKDGKNALNHATNDFITLDEVNQGLVDAGAGSFIKANDVNVTYQSIVIKAEIVDGKLTKYEISYIMDVTEIQLKALGVATVKGSGAGKMDATYSDFKY